MLQEISIKDFAIIDNLDLKFYPNMNVLSGETGAGKSIIIDAVGLLAGGRGSSHFIRKGESKAVLQGMFSIPKNGATASILEDVGIENDDDTLILQRELYRSGRNVCRINGMLVNTSTLKKVGETLVDIYGQNEHQALMQPEKHIGLLDEYADGEINPLLTQYREEFQHYNELKNKIKHKNENQKAWEQRLDMLKFQTKEIESAELAADEEEKLTAERDQLNNFQEISQNLSESFDDINGNDNMSPLDLIGQAMSAMEDLENMGDQYKSISESVKGAYYQLQDASSEIENQMDSLEYNPNRLEEVESRLNEIYELKKKYGDSIKEILNYDEKISKELADMENEENNGDDLEDQLQRSRQKLTDLSGQLSEIRHKTGARLTKNIHQQLSDLFMDKTEFKVVFKKLPDGEFNQNGNETLQFYLRTNPGEEMLPLEKIASGGELSRIMLALKTIFAKVQGVTSIIFDEVDTGVSGRVAQAIADKISAIGRQSQVLCITHLPQVAAMANHQFFISKHVDKNNRTETSVKPLTGDARIEELARMLAGTKVTKLTREHASELLRLANQEKAQRNA